MLHVEDDQFQQMTFSAVASSIGQGDSGLSVQVTTVETANAALEALEDGKKAFDLVLLDYLLPDGHNGDTVLPKMRKLLGPYAAIIMLSGDAQEAPMQRCWLDLGADSYRLKPVSRATVEELFRTHSRSASSCRSGATRTSEWKTMSCKRGAHLLARSGQPRIIP